jgi:hypothetical protein
VLSEYYEVTTSEEGRRKRKRGIRFSQLRVLLQ